MADAGEYVINGEDVAKGRWPWILSLEVLDPEFRHTCGATLIGMYDCVLESKLELKSHLSDMVTMPLYRYTSICMHDRVSSNLIMEF